jgi:Flp pilus assembly protein TadB
LGNLLTALLVTAGLFLCLGIRAADMPEKKKSRRRRIRFLLGKLPGRIERMASEAEQMLTAAGMQAQLGTYKRLALVLGMAGLLIGAAIGNLLAAAVLGVGLAVMPLLIIRIRTGDYLRGLYESLESGMGSITNAYVAGGDLIGAIEDSLRLIPAPVDEVFRKFLSQIRLVDASVPRALQAMKGQIDNRYWQEWVNTLIQCQGDRTLRYALPGIVERLGAMRRIRMEADTLLQKQIGDYVVTVFLLLGSIPVMAFMMPDWYEMLTRTIAGQITLAVVLGAGFSTALWIGRRYHPKEGGGKA